MPDPTRTIVEDTTGGVGVNDYQEGGVDKRKVALLAANLAEQADLAAADFLPAFRDDGTGTPVPVKITLANLAAMLAGGPKMFLLHFEGTIEAYGDAAAADQTKLVKRIPAAAAGFTRTIVGGAILGSSGWPTTGDSTRAVLSNAGPGEGGTEGTVSLASTEFKSVNGSDEVVVTELAIVLGSKGGYAWFDQTAHHGAVDLLIVVNDARA